MKQANDQVFSAGTQPTEVRKEAIRVMRELECLGSSLEAAERLHRPRLDFAITVCDKAREECPIFPGRRSGSIGRLRALRPSPKQDRGRQSWRQRHCSSCTRDILPLRRFRGLLGDQLGQRQHCAAPVSRTQ